MIKQEIIVGLKGILKGLGGGEVAPLVTFPGSEKHGDYTTNVAMVVFPNLKERRFENPLDLARKIAEELKAKTWTSKTFEKIEAVPPGFINFYLSASFLSNQLKELLGEKKKVDQTPKSLGQKIMVEFAHPNTHKEFHIGHLRNVTIGESIVRLLEAKGYEVIRANYEGDVGMHIAKAIYALLHLLPFSSKIAKIKGIHERVEFLGKAYVAGNKAFEEDETAKQKIKDINYQVYASAQRFQEEKGIVAGSTDYLKFLGGKTEEVDKVFELWKETRQWSLDYFETIYKRVYTHYDRYYFESECLSGVDIAKEAVEKGILEKSDGAIIFNGKKYGLDTRVFVNSLGLPTYEAKELALAQKEFSEFGELFRLIHVVGPEQTSFFKVTFKVEELLDSEKYKDKQYHLAYGWVRLKHGKMSSRKGEVVLGEWLLDETKAQIKKQFPDMEEETLEKVATGAVKYSMLKFSTTSEIVFSFEESISLEGNSGPYLQYTYARTQSVLAKSQITNSKSQINSKFKISNIKFEPEETSLLRLIHRFPEVVEEAADNFAPNLLCNYLFDLAQKFNLFYQRHKVIGSKEEEFRLALTAALGQILKQGLYFLGIEAPERM